MILQIREGVFETNSSSTHTITICSEKTFDEWTAENSDIVYVGDSYDFSFDGRNFVTKEEVLEKVAENNALQVMEGKEPYYDIENFFDPEANSTTYTCQSQAAECGVYTFEEWREDEYLETYVKDYTTENGEKVVAFGKYGTQY